MRYFIFILFFLSCSLSVKDRNIKNKGFNGVYGTIYQSSDIANKKSVPLNGIVISILADSVNSFFQDIEFDIPGEITDWSIKRISKPVSKEIFEDRIFEYTGSNNEGEYTLPLPQGTYIICLANAGAVIPGDYPPIFLNGCVKVMIKDNSIRKDLYWGEGGLFSD